MITMLDAVLARESPMADERHFSFGFAARLDVPFRLFFAAQ
jgi:hypothetical protein